MTTTSGVRNVQKLLLLKFMIESILKKLFMNNDNAELDINGHKLSISRAGSSGNFFLFLLIIIGAIFLAFCFFINPLISFIVVVPIFLGIIIYACVMFYLHPENFTSNEVWLEFMRDKFGDKQKGLHESTIDGELVQPTIVNQSITGRARIKKGDIE